MGYIENNSIDLDFRNHSYLRSFIEAHKDDRFPLTGVDEQGQMITVSAVDDNVDVCIFQNNGHTMHHTYWLDYTVEEWFEN